MIAALLEIVKGWDGVWQFVFLVCTGSALITAGRQLINRVIRSINVMIRGWPPEHLDADGDSIAEIVARQEVKLAEKQKSSE